MLVNSENRHKYEVSHKGGFGLFWIAVGIVLAAAILSPNKEQVDCFIGVMKACAQISENYK